MYSTTAPAAQTGAPKKDGTWLLSCGHFLNDFYCNFLPILLPIIMPQLGLSLTLSGLLVMVLSITSNMLQPVFGYVMDRHNLSRLLIPVIPFGAVCICSIGLITTKVMLFIIIALTGLSVSAFHPLGSTLVARTAEAARQGRSMSYYIAGGNLGYALAPIIIVAYLNAFSMSDLPLLMIPGFLFALICLRSGLTHFSTVTDLAKTKTFHLGEILHNASILRLNIAMGLRCITHVSMSTFLPLLLVTSGYSGILSGSLLTLFLVGCTVGGLTGGYLGDRFAHKRIIIAALALAIFPTAYFYLHPGTEPLSLIALFLSGALLLASQPSSLVWAQRAMPGSEGMASGMMLGLSFGLGSFGTALVAALGDQIGLSSALLLSSLTLPLAAICAVFAPFPEEKA
ncbi:MFS transporter [Mitsuokella sp. AF21-1AC]|uniref:MFS transporter n=1 Tax=Mitsuokella sp. AF21-1AC TaxID=2292235 RepID=UPI000E50B8FA|nr:MFS transporter [Mitsuokella sp. AF21-1AC]RGS72237.1 MFS transporter [Mitsuokella sp. AF21-1AC]